MFETNGTFEFFRVGLMGNHLHAQVSPISDSDVRTKHTAKDMNKLAGILFAVDFLEASTISVVVSTNEAFLSKKINTINIKKFGFKWGYQFAAVNFERAEVTNELVFVLCGLAFYRMVGSA